MQQYRDTDYAAVSAALHAREAKLLTQAMAERMIDAATPEESYKTLLECGYAPLERCTLENVEHALSKVRRELYHEVSVLAPDKRIIELFQVKYDYHNAKLALKSKRTGERWSWESFGAEQDMELSELKNARNSNKKYFINNWFMFDEDWVIDYLGMRQYYKNSLNIQDFDQLFKKPVGEIENIISKLSEGQRKSVAYRAKQLIAEEEIDSNRVINTLEKCLGVELVER